MLTGVSLRMELRRILCPALLVTVLTIVKAAAPYYGTKIGSFNTHVHDVVGDVFAVDERTIFIKDFSYDGQGPDAYFWGGSSGKPDTSGFIIPDERGKKTPLKEYRNKDLLLRLPAGKTLRNIKWLSVWCRKFNANFGDLIIPQSLVIPAPVEIGRIPTKEHGVSSGPVMVVDTQTLLVPEFTYDGLGPAAYWWVSRGSRQHPRGLRLADENGSYAPLPKYTGRTVVITLPDDLTIYDFDWFGVWCEEARVDFGSVALPQKIVVPPSPRTLGVELEYKLNCEVLRDDLGYEVRWIMDGEDIVMQLVGKLEPGEYMAFGLSKNDSKSDMNNADAVVAYMDKRRKGHGVDYFLGSKEQCVGRRGSCPDVKLPDGQDSVTLLNSAVVNGYTMITLKRPQVGMDEKYDQHIYSDGPQAVVWAIGQLNDKNEVSYHGALKSEGDIYIDFARPPQWNCPQPAEPEYKPEPSIPSTTTIAPKTTTRKSRKPTSSNRGRIPKPTSETFTRKPQPIGPRYASRAVDVEPSAATINRAWNVPPIMCPADRTFRAQIGPSGGKKGYQLITGGTGWGIAWYINGILIPEITLERGKTYTFIVEGGNDPENSAKSHPFYITDDPEGGYEYKTAEERKKVKIYAGVTKDSRGDVAPTAMGRLCEYKLPKDLSAEDFDTFEEFQKNLELRCERGKQGRFTFKPDKDTPDLLYYQCFTHRYFGWKINVVDSCNDKPQPIGPRYTSRAVDVEPIAATSNKKWNVPPVVCPADRTLQAQIGPSGGKKGYQLITGRTGWGITWYINGILIPEITLERGKTYTFIIEGGNDPENSARSHPFYITDDPEGGYEYKTAEEKKKVKIYAGVTKDRRGNVTPNAMGRLCEYKLPKDLEGEDFDTFEEFQENLELRCERGKAGRLTFRPDRDTPDLLYYQCFTHRYLGWKIHVVDSCDEKGLRYEASVQHVRNITYNTFESDYKRGGDKKKLSSSEEEKYVPKYFGGNDGIPLDLSEVNDDKKKSEKKDGDESQSQKHLYYKPSSSVYFSSPNYYFSTSVPVSSELYYKPTTSEKNRYFYTTPKPKSHYYKPSTTPAPAIRKTTYKVNTPTMEPFRIRDVVHAGSVKGKYNIKPTTTKQSSHHKTIVVSPGQTAPLKLRVYLSTPKPAVYTLGPYSGTTRSGSQWWNKQAPVHDNRKKAISSLRTQISAIQAANQDPRIKSTRPVQGGLPSNAHYERSFIPVVIKNNGSFDTVVVRSPGYNHPHGSPAGHYLALSATTHNGRNIVPVLIRAKEPDRRTIDNSARGGIQTPLGKLPYPNTSARNKASGAKSAQGSGESFLPLLVPHSKVNKTTDKKSVAPLIPLVVPEKKDDNLYILHQMLSLLNENPQSIVARGIKIVGTSKEKNIRPRIKRSADHHPDHTHEHDHSSHSHEDHDHNHEGHHMHHTDPSKEKATSGTTFFSISLDFLMLTLIISLWKGYKSNII